MFTLRTIFDEVAYVEILNGKFVIEIIILRQQHEYLFKNKDLFVVEVNGFRKQW